MTFRSAAALAALLLFVPLTRPVRAQEPVQDPAQDGAQAPATEDGAAAGDDDGDDAQGGAAKGASPREAAKRAAAERRERRLAEAYAMLDEAISAARSLTLPENRLVNEAAGLFLLWPHDEARARSLAKELVGDMGELMRVAAESDEADPVDPRYGETERFETIYTARATLIMSIADRDPAFALDLLRATPIPSTPRTTAYAARELQTESEIASRLVSKSPKEAMRVARECLDRGVFGPPINMMNSMRYVEPALAAQLASEIAKAVASQDLLSSSETAYSAFNLLSNAIQSDPQAIYTNAEGQTLPLPPLLDASTVRLLAAQLVGAATSAPTSQSAASIQLSLCGELLSIAPAIGRISPALGQSLKARAAKLPSGYTGKDTAWESWNAVAQTGDVDAMIEAAGKADPTYRQNFYMQAAQYAMSKGDAERARSIISGHVADAGERDRMLAEIDQQSASAAVQSDELVKSRAAIARVRMPGPRAVLLAQLARSTAAKDRKTALSLADEAAGLLEGIPRNTTQFGERLNVGEALASVDAKRARTVLDPVAERLNALVEASSVLDGYMCGSGAFRDGEMRVQQSPIGSLGDMLASTLGTIAMTNFPLARDVTEQVDRPEVRVAIQFMLLRNALPQFEQQDADAKMGVIQEFGLAAR